MQPSRENIWQYLETLRKPDKNGLFSKNKIGDKLVAFDIIGRVGTLSVICYLTPFLKSSNPAIRVAACDAIIQLIKTNGKKNEYYNAFRNCDISIDDILFFERTFPNDKLVEILCVCSQNGSGYVREEAVVKLSKVGETRAIQFLIYRLADWVEPVRNAATAALGRYMNPMYLEGLIENLPTFEWLKTVERVDLSGVFLNIVNYIVNDNRVYILKNFRTYPDKLRFLLAKHISKSPLWNANWLAIFIQDSHFKVRGLALDHFDQLTENDIRSLRTDMSPKVRLQTLRLLKSDDEFDRLVSDYIADSSPSIRYFARYTLRDSIPDFATVYNQNLSDNKSVIASLAGLAELNAEQYAAKVEEFLASGNLKIRKAAFRALTKLDGAASYRFALASFSTATIGIRKMMIDFLSTVADREVLELARICLTSGDYEMKKSGLVMFNRIGGWAVVSDLMLGTIDNDERIRQLSFTYLQQWRHAAVRLFTVPKKEDAERALKILNFAREVHIDKKYFNSNPLTGLDFFFR